MATGGGRRRADAVSRRLLAGPRSAPRRRAASPRCAGGVGPRLTWMRRAHRGRSPDVEATRAAWTLALELAPDRSVTAGSKAGLAATIGRGADLRVYTEFL